MYNSFYRDGHSRWVNRKIRFPGYKTLWVNGEPERGARKVSNESDKVRGGLQELFYSPSAKRYKRYRAFIFYFADGKRVERKVYIIYIIYV